MFDGPGPRGTEPSPKHLTVIHAGHGGRDSADDRIVELVGALPARAMVLVYTSDAALRARLHAMGAQVVGAPGAVEGYRGCTYHDHRLADVYFGQHHAIIERRRKIKELTIQKRRLAHHGQAASH